MPARELAFEVAEVCQDLADRVEGSFIDWRLVGELESCQFLGWRRGRERPADTLGLPQERLARLGVEHATAPTPNDRNGTVGTRHAVSRFYLLGHRHHPDGRKDGLPFELLGNAGAVPGLV